jgi:hypothetical protein
VKQPATETIVKKETRKDRILTKTEAADLYALEKGQADKATQEDVVRFLMTRDGNPDQAFVAKVTQSKDAYLDYVRSISSALTDSDYCEMFYGLTGKVLIISPDHAFTWANKIADQVLKESQSPG